MPPTGERQTMLFSATFPKEIQRLAAGGLHCILRVVIRPSLSGGVVVGTGHATDAVAWLP